MTASIVKGVDFCSERESGPWIECSTCSAAMAAHWHKPSVDATLATAHRIRSAAEKPHSGGLTPAEVKEGLHDALGLNAAYVAKSDIPAKVRAGYAVIVPLNAGSLPSHLRRWQPNFAGGHSICLVGVSSSGKFGWFDPLAPAGYSGEWVNWSDIDQAVWSSGALALPKYVAPPAPPAPAPTLKYGGKAMSGRKKVTKNDVRIREKPTTSARILRQVDSGATFAARQYTDTGTSVSGSRRWYGTRDGNKWVHSSLVRSDGSIRNNETVR